MPSDDARRVRAAITQREWKEPVSVEDDRLGWETEAAETNAGLCCAATPLDLYGVPGELVEELGASNVNRSMVLFLHGGGYHSGSPRTHPDLALRIAGACGGAVVLPDYRLAPEHPCPAAVEDAVTSYRWLLDQRYPANQIVVAGDSAGGGLVAALLIALRDLGLPRPAAGVLISPWVDLTLSGASYDAKATADPFVTRSELVRAGEHYLAGRDPSDPMASPLFADLHDLPPMLIHVGSEEILESDAVQFAEAAAAAGGDVHLSVWKGLWHVFHFWAAEVPESHDAIAEIGAFIRSATAPCATQYAGTVGKLG